MDPNAILQRLRDAEMAIDTCDPGVIEVNELIDAVAAIDAWLSKGGFPPDDWRTAWRDRPGMVLADPRPAF